MVLPAIRALSASRLSARYSFHSVTTTAERRRLPQPARRYRTRRSRAAKARHGAGPVDRRPERSHPRSCSMGTMARLGASRMSSVFGLNVRPRTAIVLLRTEPPAASSTRIAMASLRSWLTRSTCSMIDTGALASRAVRIRAETSLGKHEPP